MKQKTCSTNTRRNLITISIPLLTLAFTLPAVTASATPENNYRSGDTGVQNWVKEMIGYPENGPKGAGVTIAVIDTGVDATRLGLAERLTTGYNSTTKLPFSAGASIDTGGHGTHVAGIIHSLAPEATIMPIIGLDLVSVTRPNGSSPLSESIRWAANNGADIINISLGLPISSDNAVKPTCAAVKYANKKGVIVITAAGNGGEIAEPLNPASCPGAIAVGAVDAGFNIPLFTARNMNLAFATPGVGVNSFAARNYSSSGFANYFGYTSESGTSMASPVMAAIVALTQSGGKYATDKQMIQALIDSATDTDTPGWDDRSGWGVPNLNKTLNAEQPVRGVAALSQPAIPVIGSNFNVTESGITDLKFHTNEPANYSVEIFNPETNTIVYTGTPEGFTSAPWVTQQILLIRVISPEYQQPSGWMQVYTDKWAGV